MKKFTALLLTLAITLSLAGAALAGTPVKIGATPSPHAEILEAIKAQLAEKGFDLEVVQFNDYVIPNNATETGELDANYFQHRPYMDDFNASAGTHMFAAIPVHFEPMAIYPGRTAKLEDIKDGATIAVPNDPTNEARALLLLEAQGLLKIAEGKGLSATKLDVIENPHNIQLYEIEAAQVPTVLPDVDFAVINGNYALGFNLFASKDSVAFEAIDSLAAETYINYIVVKQGNEGAAFLQALREVLASEETIAFIAEKYQGAVIGVPIEAVLAAPTAVPTVAPTEAPTAVPTEVPVVATEAPVVATEAPVVATEAPTAAPAN